MREKPRFHVHGSKFRLGVSHRGFAQSHEEENPKGKKSKMEKRRIRKRLEAEKMARMKGDDVE